MTIFIKAEATFLFGFFNLCHVASGEPGRCAIRWWSIGERRQEQGSSLQTAHPDQGYLLQATHAEQTFTDR